MHKHIYCKWNIIYEVAVQGKFRLYQTDFKCRGLVSSLGFRMLVNVQIAEFQEINSVYYNVKAVRPKEKRNLLERTYSSVYMNLQAVSAYQSF